MTDKYPSLPAQCAHDWVTSTVKLGPHCAGCKEPLAGLFWPISRNTPAGALIYALRTSPQETP